MSELHERHATCRDAVPGDIAAIVRFQILMAKETEDVDLDPETCRRGVQAVFDRPGLGRYFVVETDGEVVGSLMITCEWSDWRARQVWWIQSVFVEPEHRGRGLYRTLYDHVKALVAADDGVSGIRLYVDQRNRSAQSVYERLGMDGGHYRVYEWMK